MILRFSVKSVRRELTPYVPSVRREDGTWSSHVEATYDHPYLSHRQAVTAFCGGQPTPGYEVKVEERLGEGTTVEVVGRSVSRGWDDYDYCTYATFRTPEGEWREVYVSSDSHDEGNYAAVDATEEVLAAWKAHLAAEQERREAKAQAEAERRLSERQAAERAAVERGRFVLVARGRKVPVGTVGRVFHIAVSEYGLRVGIATSTRTEKRLSARGREVDAALDVAWVAADNLDVLLPELPSDPREVELLYRCAAAVASHARWQVYEAAKAARAAYEEAGDPDAQWVPEPDPKAPVVDAFGPLWRWAVERPERLAVMLAYGPGELPRLDAETPRTLEEVCDAVESMPDVARRAGRYAWEWPGPAATAEEIGAIRADVALALGVVYEPPPPKRRAPRKAKAAKPAAAGTTEAA